MSKKIVIYGAGGFGREVQWLIERINQQEPTWEILGYIDDGVQKGNIIDDCKVIGGIDYLLKFEEELAVAFAVGSAKLR